MNTKWKVILLVMLTIIGICSVFIALFIFDSRDNLQTFIENKIYSIRAIVQNIEEVKSTHYRHRIKTYVSSKNQEKAIRAFTRRDRDELLRLSAPFFKAFKKEDPIFGTFAWVTLDNHGFLRVHHPSVFDDNLGKIRPDVVLANKEHQQYSGYMVGKAGLQYSIVQPISYKGQHVGAVHFGLKGNHLLDVVCKKLSIPVGTAIPKKKFSTIKQSKMPFFEGSTHTIHSRQIDLFQQDSASIDWSLDRQKVTLQGRTYIIANAFNFLNYNQEQQGCLFVALDITQQEEKLQSRIIFILIGSGALLLLSFLIINSSYGSLVQKIITLNQSLEKNNSELENKVYERTAKLQEEKKFQENLLNDMITFVSVLEPSGAVIFVNNTPLKLAGLELEDIIGKNFFDAPWWTHSDEVQDMIISDIKQCAAGKSLMHDVQIQIADGSLMWIEFSMHPIFDEQGAVQYLIPEGRDITDRKQSEIAIRKSEEQWDRTFSSFTDIVTIQDVDMNIIKINQAGCDLLNLTCDEITGQSCHKLFHDSSTPCPDCPLLITRESFEPYTREMTHEKFGKTFLVSASPVLDDQGNLMHIAHVAKDITSIKKSEEDRIRLAAAIDQTAEAIVITDIQGNIQYINPAFENITGYKRTEVIGQNPRILKSGKHDSLFYEEMWSILLQGNVWKGHLINKRKDGSLYEEETTISPVKNSNGEITNFVAVKYDVSKEISLEQQLRQAMKMEAIGTLAGGIAHDFNNILAAILGYSEIARAELADDDQIARDLDQVIIAGKRATELVKQILTFSRQGEEDLQPLKIQLVIKEALKLLRSSLPSTIQLKQDIADNTGLILADPTQMHQVMMNLCTNAKHAIGAESGTLSISLSEVQITDSDTIADCPQLENGSYLDLAISDTGCGIDGLTLSRIFDPFFTTKEKEKGTGLGLAVVHGIIKQHKGEITVASEHGLGSTFHVYLPIIEEEMPAQEVRAEEIPRGSERILLVDDEPPIVQMMQRMLQKLGYTVTAFTSSIEALAAYKKNPGDFDLVITDMTMPDMTGIALTKELFALREDLPVILSTGFSEIMDEKKAKSLGIREYIMKPVVQRTLAKAIRNALITS